ncbi:hypothetical protein F4859DRAFT_509596 [Xylaria cf. heliscus]|nr:hypothetical protein F4859DRAFT_509596 [Xylaria cf. heliscus]
MRRHIVAVAPQQDNLRNEQPQNRIVNTAQQPENRTPEPAQPDGWQPQANAESLSDGPPPNALGTCSICNGDYPTKDLCALICGHIHCRDCLQMNFRTALESRPFLPARCCLTLSIDQFHDYDPLTEKEVREYHNRMEELTTTQGKLYCWGCAAYISIDRRTKRIGDCDLCGKRTCRTCRAKSHFGPCDKTKLQADKAAEDSVVLLDAFVDKTSATSAAGPMIRVSLMSAQRNNGSGRNRMNIDWRGTDCSCTEYGGDNYCDNIDNSKIYSCN